MLCQVKERTSADVMIFEGSEQNVCHIDTDKCDWRDENEGNQQQQQQQTRPYGTYKLNLSVNSLLFAPVLK